MRADAATTHHPSSLRDYLDVVRRRKWFILQAAVIVPIVTVLLSLTQQKVFQSSAQVLLNRQNLANGLTGTPDASLFLQADRVAQTQADLARVATIAQNVLKAVHVPGETVSGFLANSSVSGLPNSDILQFTVKAHSPQVSRALASEYARQYTIYRHQLDTSSLQRARANVQKRIAQLKAKNGAGGALYDTLLSRDDTLATMEVLQTSNASVVQSPTGAAQIQPRPVRNGAIGIALGLVLGLTIAFLAEALDTRVRSSDEVSERLGRLPLLGRLPRPARALRASNRLAMLAAPDEADAEAFRMLRSQFDLARLETGARSVMITSAVAEEGKSTTVANLAIAVARAGDRVILVDLDLYKPSLHRFFSLGGPGLTDVVHGHAKLDDALAPIALTDLASPNGTWAYSSNGNGSRESRGLLEVLPAGPTPLEPGDFMNRAPLRDLILDLQSRADVVLIDSSPLLFAGAGMTLSTKVDGILVVSRVSAARRRTLAEFGRLLSRSPTPKLGLIVTGDSDETGYDVYAQAQAAYRYTSRRGASRQGIAP